MPNLHLSRVAFGASDLSVLKINLSARAQAGEVRFTTRNRPRRADELIGGYLHFIIRHTLVARVQIVRFDEAAEGRTDIVCSDRIELVQPVPRRAHQGWRYLQDVDAPPLLDADSGVADLPPALARELSNLALI
ncbi:MAG: DUF1489 family protein [Sphingopyxis sp.]|nr:DUF1489 family protein [Sphingopyxis sp.]